jgi:hypothetical protein
LRKLDPVPLDELPDTISFGGPIPWFSITLSITADNLDPAEVTRLLGLEPDEARQRGVPDVRGRVPRLGAWIIRLRSDQTPEWDVGLAINSLLDRIPASAAWDQALSHADARVFVGLRLDAFNRGLRLPVHLMKRLINLDLCLDLDIYATTTDEV